jgi:hypothetical protein
MDCIHFGCLDISCHSSRKTNSTSVSSPAADVQNSIPYYLLNNKDDLEVLIKRSVMHRWFYWVIHAWHT